MSLPKAGYFFPTLPKSVNTDESTVETTDNTTAPKMAATQPEIISPGTMAETINNTTALITKVKRPSVTIVIGALTNDNAGLTKVLTTPNTMAAKIAVV